MNNHWPDPKKFYDSVMISKFGDNYENTRWKKNAMQEAQYDMTAEMFHLHVLPAAKGAARILEVGPGPGTWTKLLLGANPEAQYTLVDISEEMLEQAREALAGRANVTFVESDFLAFESPQPFDFFLSSRAIEYMPDKAAAASKIASLLARGARGAVITKTPKLLFNRLRGRNIADLHKWQIAPRPLAQTLKETGLRILAIYPVTATVPLFNSATLNRLAYRMLRRFPLIFPFSLFTESYGILFQKV